MDSLHSTICNWKRFEKQLDWHGIKSLKNRKLLYLPNNQQRESKNPEWIMPLYGHRKNRMTVSQPYRSLNAAKKAVATLNTCKKRKFTLFSCSVWVELSFKWNNHSRQQLFDLIFLFIFAQIEFPPYKTKISGSTLSQLLPGFDCTVDVNHIYRIDDFKVFKNVSEIDSSRIRLCIWCWELF